MNKKFLSAILFGTLMVSSTGTFVSCKDYDDDIDNLQGQITANADAIKALQDLVGSGKYVTSVAKTAIPGSIPFFYPDGKYRIFKFISHFQLHPVMCAKLLFHTGDWNCQTIEKQ